MYYACTKYVYTCASQSEYFSFAGVREWDELPSEVYERFLSLKAGFKARFNPSSFLLTGAALVHPGHNSLSWLEPTRREEAIQQFKDELLIVAGIEGLQTRHPHWTFRKMLCPIKNNISGCIVLTLT